VNQVKEVKDLLQTWQGRQFQARCPIRKLHSDASNVGWGGLDIQSGTGLQEFWRQENGLHINVKELHAAISTVRSLAKKGEQVHLAVDNVVAYSYLKKSGGKLPQFNHMLRPFLKWCMEQKVRLLPSLVKSEDMLADTLSRMPADTGDYSLDPGIFQQIQNFFAPQLCPQVEIFASPGNHKLEKFVSQWPHWQAWGWDALHMDLEGVSACYANPPWTIILAWLERLRLHPHVCCLMVVPYWVGAVWWPLLVKMRKSGTPVLKVEPRWGLFTSCLGEVMPPTKWPLVCLILSGSAWRADKFRLPTFQSI
jgi:hypothetical protein